MGLFADISSAKADTAKRESLFSGIESVDAVPKGFWEELPDALERGFYNIVEKTAGMAKTLIEHPLPMTPLWVAKKVAGEKNPMLWIAKHAGRLSEAARLAGQAPEIQPDMQQTAGAFVASVLGEAAPYVGATLGAAATGGIGPAAALTFAVEGQSAYDDAIATGATPEEAATEAYIVGGVNALIELSNVGKVLGRMKSGPTIGRACLDEGAGVRQEDHLRHREDLV